MKIGLIGVASSIIRKIGTAVVSLFTVDVDTTKVDTNTITVDKVDL